MLASAPTDSATELNTLRAALRPVTAWGLADVHFAFDSSVLLPTMIGDLARLRLMLLRFVSHPVTIFGHADTTGNDGYNKQLSGRRATALYGLLTRKVEHWEKLFATPMGRDDWKQLQVIDTILKPHLEAVGRPVGAGASRGQIFLAYMDAVCRDADGRSFGVSPNAFLGKGADPGGKVDFQGCGELNPVVIASAEEAKRFAAATDHTERDAAGAANRRVVLYFFPPGTEIQPKAWPCPRASEGLAACQLRLWSDAGLRRTPQGRRREHPEDRDTFACRFYDRLALEPVRAGSVRLRLTVPSAASKSVAPVVLQATSGDTRLAVDPKEVTRDNRGGSYHVFELDQARELPTLLARLERQAPPPAPPGRALVAGPGAPVAAIQEPAGSVSPDLGLDLISLLANLDGPAALARSLGLPLPAPPSPQPSQPPPEDLPPVDDREFFFENPLAPEDQVPLEFRHGSA